MMRRVLPAALFAALISTSAWSQPVPGPTPGGGGSGSVNGPASAVDSDIAVYDGTTGKLLKDGGTLSTLLDGIGSTRGSVIYRGVSGWTVLTPGTNGFFLKSNGAGADPTYAAAPGGGTVTNVATGNGLCGGPITTTGTLSTCVLQNAQTGTTYATVSGDGGKVVSLSNAGAVAVSLSQANQTGFTAGFGLDYHNIGAGAVTITATTSTFDNGLTTLGVVKGQDAYVWSDGTNYHSMLSLPVMAADTVLGNFSGTSNYPIAASLSSCSTASSALTYDTTAHAFGCNTISGGGSGTVNAGTAGDVGYYATSAAAISDGAGAGITLKLPSLLQMNSGATGFLSWGASSRFSFDSGGSHLQAVLTSSNAAGFNLSNSAASSTAPTFNPNKADTTTGIGAQASGNMSLIVGGVEKSRYTAEGLQYKQATAPVPSGTGSPTIATGSTDEAGEVTAGTSATSVIITFNLTHTNAPFCVVESQSQITSFAYTLSNTAITITQTATSGNKIDYRCTFP